MFAVITSSRFWKLIDNMLKNIDANIVYKSIDEDIEIISELENISRLPVRKLIIDFSMLEDEQKLAQAIRRLRIKKDNIQIIIMAPGCLPGNPILSSLVKMGVYDILNPDIEDADNMEELILEVLERPTSYSKAVKWDMESVQILNSHHSTKKDKGEKEKQEVAERTVTITKEKIIGTVIIAIAGSIGRIGTTHTAISMAKYLSTKKFKVAVVELFPTNSFNFIKNAYEEIESYHNNFLLSDISFYPYNEALRVTDLLQKDFNYIILDMGIYKDCNIDEFHRANKKILLSGVKDWELGGLESILKETSNIYISKYTYVFNFSDTPTFDFVNKNMDNLEVYKAGYNPNPLEITKDAQVSFSQMLKDLLPLENKKDSIPFIDFLRKKKKEVGL